MYKSPIEIFTTDIQTQIMKQQEEEIYKAIVNVGINVDKDELIRALQYDRGQYTKGYLDAQAEILRCKDCEYTCPGTSGLVCTMWGAGTDPDGWCYKGERREGE